MKGIKHRTKSVPKKCSQGSSESKKPIQERQREGNGEQKRNFFGTGQYE